MVKIGKIGFTCTYSQDFFHANSVFLYELSLRFIAQQLNLPGTKQNKLRKLQF